MTITNKDIKVVENVENWIIGVIGSFFGLFVTIGGFFFKNFFKRLGKAEEKVAKLEAKTFNVGRVSQLEIDVSKIKVETSDFRDMIKSKMKTQQEQNTNEHSNLKETITTGLTSLGRSVDIIRSDQKRILDYILDNNGK